MSKPFQFEYEKEISILSERVATLEGLLQRAKFFINSHSALTGLINAALATPAPPTTQQEINQRVNMEHDSMAAVIEGKADGVTPNRQAKSENSTWQSGKRVRRIPDCPTCFDLGRVPDNSLNFVQCPDCPPNPKRDADRDAAAKKEHEEYEAEVMGNFDAHMVKAATERAGELAAQIKAKSEPESGL